MTELSLKTLLIVLLGYPIWGSAANLSLDAPEAELSAHLEQFESTSESTEARRWVEQLLDYQEQTRQPHPEHLALDLPRYALAARAHTLLKRWDEQRAFQRMQDNPTQHSKALIEGAELRARIRWINQASEAQIATFRSNIASDALPEPLLLALAIKQNKHADDLALAQLGRSRSGLDRLRSRVFATATTTEQRQALLSGMRENPAYRGSVAAFHAEWLKQNPKQLQHFSQNQAQQNWTQEHVETLLRLRTPNLMQQLQGALHNANTANLAAWGLWQLQTTESRQALARYVDSPDAIPQLARELSQWLR